MTPRPDIGLHESSIRGWKAKLPQWITYTPGIVSILSLTATYVGGLAATHGACAWSPSPRRGVICHAVQAGTAPDRGPLQAFPGS
jgi:hypothetical protein